MYRVHIALIKLVYLFASLNSAQRISKRFAASNIAASTQRTRA
jgi:hypothetical protein